MKFFWGDVNVVSILGNPEKLEFDGYKPSHSVRTCLGYFPKRCKIQGYVYTSRMPSLKGWELEDTTNALLVRIGLAVSNLYRGRLFLRSMVHEQATLHASSWHSRNRATKRHMSNVCYFDRLVTWESGKVFRVTASTACHLRLVTQIHIVVAFQSYFSYNKVYWKAIRWWFLSKRLKIYGFLNVSQNRNDVDVTPKSFHRFSLYSKSAVRWLVTR